MTPQGYPLWAAWETYYGPVIGWQEDESGGRWWPVVVEGGAGEVAAVECRYVRVFATEDEARAAAGDVHSRLRAEDAQLCRQLIG